MKIYNKYDMHRFAFPKDMELILDYLRKHGEILVNEHAVESLYFDFSYKKYSAGWMSVDDKLLEEFADWLDKYELDFD